KHWLPSLLSLMDLTIYIRKQNCSISTSVRLLLTAKSILYRILHLKAALNRIRTRKCAVLPLKNSQNRSASTSIQLQALTTFIYNRRKRKLTSAATILYLTTCSTAKKLTVSCTIVKST